MKIFKLLKSLKAKNIIICVLYTIMMLVAHIVSIWGLVSHLSVKISVYSAILFTLCIIFDLFFAQFIYSLTEGE